MGLEEMASVAWRATESCEALREGGPTKREGAGRRFGFVLVVGDVLCTGEAVASGVVGVDMLTRPVDCQCGFCMWVPMKRQTAEGQGR